MEIQEFGSLTELLDFAEHAPACSTNQLSRATTDGYTADWSGTDTFEQAAQLARSGWTEGAERIRKLRDVVYDSVSRTVLKPTPYFDIEGSAIDMARFVDGEPECVLNWRDDERPDPQVIRIWANLGGLGGFSTDQFAIRGVALGSLIDTLESTGRRVELDVSATVTAAFARDFQFSTQLKVKRAQDPFNLETLAFVLGHAAMHRRLIFACRERGSLHAVHAIGITNGLYGQTINLPKRSDIDVWLDTGFCQDIYTIDDIRTWVLNMLRNQGVRVIE